MEGNKCHRVRVINPLFLFDVVVSLHKQTLVIIIWLNYSSEKYYMYELIIHSFYSWLCLFLDITDVFLITKFYPYISASGKKEKEKGKSTYD